jgi:hypothetical protein
VYEYKQDVDYCVECCRIADAKIAHHKQKLFKRVQFVRNLIKDLDITESEDKTTQSKTVNTTDLIDYTVSFCSNSKNRMFYSIINREVLLSTDNQGGDGRI